MDPYRQKNSLPRSSGRVPPTLGGELRHNDDCPQRQTHQLESQHAFIGGQDPGGEPGPTRIPLVPGGMLEPESQNVLPSEGGH